MQRSTRIYEAKCIIGWQVYGVEDFDINVKVGDDRVAIVEFARSENNYLNVRWLPLSLTPVRSLRAAVWRGLCFFADRVGTSVLGLTCLTQSMRISLAIDRRRRIHTTRSSGFSPNHFRSCRMPRCDDWRWSGARARL